MTFKVWFSNRLLGMFLNFCFPLGATPARMRKRFDRWAGVSQEMLLRKYSNARFSVLSKDGIEAEVIEAVEKPSRTILFLHGGGYFAGSVHAYRRFLVKLAYRCHARVVAVNYRLAPEHPHPAALEDALASFRVVRQAFVGLPLIVGGDSAGGGLVAVTLLALRDRGEPQPDRAFCISAWADLAMESPSITENHGKDVWLTRRHLEAWSRWVLGGTDPKSPSISPVYGSFRGICPMLLIAGDQEVLRDDSVRLAERGRADGCETVLVIGQDMQHDAVLSLPWLVESRKAFSALVKFLTVG